MVALLNQVGEVVDATCKAVFVWVLCGVMLVMVVVVVMMKVVGAWGVVAETRARHGAGTLVEAHE